MKWTNGMIKQVAMEQSAIDANCSVNDFVCGKNIVATISEKYRDIVEKYINSYPAEHCFETPNMHVLNDAFQELGFRVCFMAEYFLPDVSMLTVLLRCF